MNNRLSPGTPLNGGKLIHEDMQAFPGTSIAE